MSDPQGTDLVAKLWAIVVSLGAVLNAATWVVTGSIWNLSISLFAASTALWLLTSERRHVH